MSCTLGLKYPPAGVGVVAGDGGELCRQLPSCEHVEECLDLGRAKQRAWHVELADLLLPGDETKAEGKGGRLARDPDVS